MAKPFQDRRGSGGFVHHGMSPWSADSKERIKLQHWNNVILAFLAPGAPEAQRRKVLWLFRQERAFRLVLISCDYAWQKWFFFFIRQMYAKTTQNSLYIQILSIACQDINTNRNARSWRKSQRTFLQREKLSCSSVWLLSSLSVSLSCTARASSRPRRIWPL